MLDQISLDDRFDLDKKQVLLSGTQALVRATLMQAARDKKNKIVSSGYVTGYRGSPLGALDQQFQRQSCEAFDHLCLRQPKGILLCRLRPWQVLNNIHPCLCWH